MNLQSIFKALSYFKNEIEWSKDDSKVTGTFNDEHFSVTLAGICNHPPSLQHIYKLHIHNKCLARNYRYILFPPETKVSDWYKAFVPDDFYRHIDELWKDEIQSDDLEGGISFSLPNLLTPSLFSEFNFLRDSFEKFNWLPNDEGQFICENPRIKYPSSIRLNHDNFINCHLIKLSFCNWDEEYASFLITDDKAIKCYDWHERFKNYDPYYCFTGFSPHIFLPDIIRKYEDAVESNLEAERIAQQKTDETNRIEDAKKEFIEILRRNY